MTVIKPDVRAAVAKELAAAEDAHGLYSSTAEKYAVMLEELEELEEEIAEARRYLAYYWRAVRSDREDLAAAHAARLAVAAERAACEAVQLAATAQKHLREAGT